MSRILVAGGAGFLGAHLCEKLLEGGHDVFCADNLQTGVKCNIKHLLPQPYFNFIQHDITSALDVDVDEIYNLACPASPVHYQVDPVQTLKININGAINMLDLSKRNNAKILQASSSEVYGDPEVHPQSEQYCGKVDPVCMRSCYIEGKRCVETLFFSYFRQYGLKIKVGRIFNTYGPRMHPDDGRVISNFIVQALKGDDITIYGTGQQTRSFCYVDDLVEGLIRLMRTPVNITGPINLGNPYEITISQLAQHILSLTGSSSRLVYLPLPRDDPRQRKPVIDRARSLLNWEPKVNLDDGLKKTIIYFEKLLCKGGGSGVLNN
ncbi:UDP-glucuronic acid decarboxylase family protein [Microbulbifer sp. CnH-101-G]|uniref:UDP-glucuronic acid decarboxylase family protein n=1 Tax=Microbulbifer sp. CnH-101-G TaxID=3243393 RepID=UPI0040399C0D